MTERRTDAELAASRDRRWTAYEEVGWDSLSLWAQGEVERIASEDGVILHGSTDAETLRKYINRYRTSW